MIFFASPRTAQLGYIANSRAARREKQIREVLHSMIRLGGKRGRLPHPAIFFFFSLQF